MKQKAGYRYNVDPNQIIPTQDTVKKTKATPLNNEESNEDALAIVLEDFDKSWEYCEGSWHGRWNDNYYLYNNNRVKVGYQGITDTFVPMTFSTIETMTSALFGTKPRFMYTPPAQKQDQNTEILNELLNYYWDKDKWSIKIINWGRDFLRLGTSIVYAYWDIDMPRLLNVPIRDFFIDPTCNNLENAAYMGRRYLTTLEELKSFEVVDLEKSTTDEVVMKPKYNNLDEVSEGKNGSGDNTDKEEKDMWYGSTVSDTDDQVEILEYWTKDRVITVANRSTVIEDTENYFKSKARKNGNRFPKGLYPFCSLRDYTDASLFYAKGEVDFIADQQELLNDLTNQNIDSITFSLNQMYTLDPRYAHLQEEIENIPGAVYPIEAGALQPIQQRPVPQDAFLERTNIKNEMRETTAANEVIKGTSQQGGGRQTATEIQAQIAGAANRMHLKITQIEDEGFHQLGTIIFAMIQLFITAPQLVRVIGKNGVQWQTFVPEEFIGDYDVDVQLESSINNQKDKLAAQAKEMYAAFLHDPEVNQTELKKLVLQRGFDLDPDEVQQLMATTQVPLNGMPGIGGGELGAIPASAPQGIPIPSTGVPGLNMQGPPSSGANILSGQPYSPSSLGSPMPGGM
jgi:hypothetical protein